MMRKLISQDLRTFRWWRQVYQPSQTVVRRAISVLLLTVGAALAAFPQVRQSPSKSDGKIKAEEAKLYADARPYMDEPLPRLKNMVHELGGLEPALSQEQLSGLLAKIAAKADELLHKVPNLISDEAVSETQRSVSQVIYTASDPERDQKFNYIVLAHPAQAGQLLEEYRTRRNGKPVSQGSAGLHFQGFVSAWVIFSSPNQVESRFRLLGQQKINGHNSFVIGFAQIPGSVEYPGKILTVRGSVPMLLQGIAWIDQSDFRIVRLRTEAGKHLSARRSRSLSPASTTLA